VLNLLWSREDESSWLIPRLFRSVVTGTCKAWLQKQLLKSRTEVPSLKIFVCVCVVIYVISAMHCDCQLLLRSSACCPFGP